MQLSADPMPFALHFSGSGPEILGTPSSLWCCPCLGRPVGACWCAPKADFWAIGSLLQVVKRTFSERQNHRPYLGCRDCMHPVQGTVYPTMFSEYSAVRVRSQPVVGLGIVRSLRSGLFDSNAVWPHKRAPNGRIGIVAGNHFTDVMIPCCKALVRQRYRIN